MGEFLRGGYPERTQMHALRVDHSEHVPANTALPGRIHPLHDEQHPPFASLARLSVEPFLQLREELATLLHGSFPGLFRAVPARRGSGINGGNLKTLSDPQRNSGRRAPADVLLSRLRVLLFAHLLFTPVPEKFCVMLGTILEEGYDDARPCGPR